MSAVQDLPHFVSGAENSPKLIRLLKAEDMAQRYGKSKSSIYRLMCYQPEQLPPAIHIGAALRWRLEDVEAWEQAKVGQR